MKILVINSGSSSLKYKLINIINKKVICYGNIERIFIKNDTILYLSKINSLESTIELYKEENRGLKDDNKHYRNTNRVLINTNNQIINKDKE